MRRHRLLVPLGVFFLLLKPASGRAAPEFPQKPGYHPDTLTLTWHADPLTTMTVQWLGGIVVDGKPTTPDGMMPGVWFSPAGKDDWRHVKAQPKPWPLHDLPAYLRNGAKIEMFLFRAHLTGLRPDTSYRFRVGTVSPEYKFRTAPSDNRRPVTFVSGGDVAIGENAVKTHQVAAAQNPLFAMIGGDLAYSNGTKAERKFIFLREWHKHMVTPDGHLIPMVAAIGNHECRGNGDLQRRAPFFAALFDGFFKDGKTYNALDFGRYLSLIILDSNHVSPIKGAQTEWFDNALAERAAIPHRLVFYHVPGWPSHRDFNGPVETEVRETWAPLMEKHRIPIAFEHHDHTYKRTHPLRGGKVVKESGVIYMGDGAWGVGIRPVKNPGEIWYIAKNESAYHCIRHTITGGLAEHVVLGHGHIEIDRVETGR
jgi:hypothetical protein